MPAKGGSHMTATQRLKQDYMRLRKDPVPYITAEPSPANILEWHYVVKGPDDSPYRGGYYHGKLVFPREFPFKPPSIYMTTPNGRFKCNTRLCLSISDFHPDTWNPAWSVSTILTGLLSFMLEKSPTLGSIETSDYTKQQLAVQSAAFNLKDKVFCELFPETTQELEELVTARQAAVQTSQMNGQVSKSSSPNGAAAGANAHIDNANQGLFSSTITNILVIVGFAAFAYAVKYIMKGLVD